MEVGLAQQMVHGSGSDQNTKHFYAGAPKKCSKCKKHKKCKKHTKKM